MTPGCVRRAWNRSKIPPLMSMKSPNAVYAMPDAIVMRRMPGSR
jgi:hypothetical protein